MLGAGVKRDHACCTSESDGEEKTEREQLIEFKTDVEEVSDRSVRGRPSRQRISAPERILGSSFDVERANSTEVISGGRTASPDIRAPVSDAQLLHPLTALSSPAAVETTPVRIIFNLVEPGLLFGIDAGAMESNFLPGEFQSIIYNHNDQMLRIRDAATGRILTCHIEDQSVETMREVRIELASYYLRRQAIEPRVIVVHSNVPYLNWFGAIPPENVAEGFFAVSYFCADTGEEAREARLSEVATIAEEYLNHRAWDLIVSEHARANLSFHIRVQDEIESRAAEQYQTSLGAVRRYLSSVSIGEQVIREMIDEEQPARRIEYQRISSDFSEHGVYARGHEANRSFTHFAGSSPRSLDVETRLYLTVHEAGRAVLSGQGSEVIEVASED
jgi:hypothetical protein